MTNKNNQNKEKIILSDKNIKIGALHPFMKYKQWAGIYSVLHSNFKALKEYYPNLETIYIGGTFDNYSLKRKETRRFDMRFWEDAKHLDRHNEIAKRYLIKLEKEIKKSISDLDGLFVENPNRGINWIFARAVRNILDNSYGNNSIIRNHDWIGNYLTEVASFFQGFENPPWDLFPSSSFVTQTCLTSAIKRQIEEYSPTKVNIIKNSIICDEFIRKEDKKDEQLRDILLKKGIMEEGVNHCGYLVRPDTRKNLEEAIYLMYSLKHITGIKHKLIIPLAPNNETQKKYVKEVKQFAEAHKVPISIGEASKYLDGKNFNVGNFYHLMHLAVQTAISGGFEFSNIESIISGTPLIGRKIREISEDLEENGMKLAEDSKCKIGSIYDNSILEAGRNHIQRLKHFDTLIKDKEAFTKSIKKLNLEMRLNYSRKHLKHNAEVVKNSYGHKEVARDIIKMLKLPGYEKLEEMVSENPFEK